MENFEKLYSEANENIVLSPDFAERTMDRIFSEEKVTRFPARKTLILIAAAILLLALGACTAAVIHYISNKTPLSYNQYYSSASDHYASHLNLYSESSGIELVLTEALFENGILTMSFDYEIDGYDYLYSLTFFGELRVDGRKTLIQNDGICYNDSEKSWYVVEYNLSSMFLTSVHEFELTVNSVDVVFTPEVTEILEYEGLWKFSFSLDTGMLTEETVIYTIDRYVTLYNGDEIYLDCIICTPITQRIIYRTPPSDENGDLRFYDVHAESPDGTLVFGLLRGDAYGSESINFNPNAFDLSAESLTLTVSITGGEEGLTSCDPFEIVCTRETE